MAIRTATIVFAEMAAVLVAADAFPVFSQETVGKDKSQSSAKIDDQELLQNLMRYDSVFLAGFKVSAVEDRIDRLDSQGPFFKVKAQWTFATSGDRTAYLIDVSSYDTPKYVAPADRSWGKRKLATRQDLEEPMTATVRTNEWGYWGIDACGNHQVDTALVVDPNGHVKEVGTIYNSYLYAPRDLSPIMGRVSLQWALGRLFSSSIDKIVSVEQIGSGRLHVTALGRAYTSVNGKWEFEIEPSAAWIVRKAKFYAASNPSSIFAEMSNEGTSWSGSYCIPKEASVNFLGSLENMSTTPGTTTIHLAFEPVVGQFDEVFYRRAQKVVLHSEQPKLTITDARISPPAVSQPYLPNPAVAIAGDAPTPLRRWLVALNLLIVLALLATVLYRKRLRNRT